MNKGQIVYFYYDNVVSCQKGRIKDSVTGGYEVDWLNSKNKSEGTSSVPSDRIFASKKECIEYGNKLENNLKDELRKSLTTKKDILEYMYRSIYSDLYDWRAEKEVLKEKIKDIFGIDI